MTSFVNTSHSAEHHGANRVESAMDAVQQMRQGFSGTRGLATLLLSAMAAAVMVVADQVMDSVAEGHLLMMWIALWAVAFAALAFFAGAARQIAVRTKNSLDAWSRNLAEARADQRLWALAKADPRVMSDLQMAIMRSEVKTEVTPAQASTTAEQAARAERALKAGAPVLRGYQRYAV
ncbi:MAG: hypothetical protein ABJA84_00250 [Polaromonas sp.]